MTYLIFANLCFVDGHQRVQTALRLMEDCTVLIHSVHVCYCVCSTQRNMQCVEIIRIDLWDIVTLT